MRTGQQRWRITGRLSGPWSAKSRGTASPMRLVVSVPQSRAGDEVFTAVVFGDLAQDLHHRYEVGTEILAEGRLGHDRDQQGRLRISLIADKVLDDAGVSEERS